MNIFEPLFLLLVVTTVVTLITAGAIALGGRSSRAGKILKRLGLGAAVYVVVVIAVSIFNPRRTYHIGDTQCFDDWCLTVAEAQHSGIPSGTRYDVALRLSNRAKRVPMGERGTVVYLSDQQGRRYDPLPDPTAVALDTVMQPGESVVAHRRFELPQDAREVGLIYTHEGGVPIGWFIIGEGGWFQKPSIVRLD